MKKFALFAAAAAALTLGAGVPAHAQSKMKVGFVYVGPVGDFGWTFQHEVGRRELMKAARRQDRHDVSGKRQRRTRLRAFDRAACARGPQADLHDIVRLHGLDREGREEIPEPLL